MVAINHYLADIHNLPFFNLLKDEEKLVFITNSKMLNEVAKSDLIFKRGEECKYIYFVLEGSVKLFYTQSEDKEHISTIVHKGQVFGECCLYNKTNHQFDAVQIEDKTKVLAVTSENFTQIMKSNFEFNMCIVKLIGDKIEKNEERLFNFAMKDARQRILSFLKDNVESNGRKVGLEMLIKHGLTQQDIANFTGTSRQTVTTVLNDLKSKNQIHLRRKSILIRDIAALA